jgi:hypothetical protein
MKLEHLATKRGRMGLARRRDASRKAPMLLMKDLLDGRALMTRLERIKILNKMLSILPRSHAWDGDYRDYCRTPPNER